MNPAASVDLSSVDALARDALEARRAGCGAVVRGASTDLRELIAFAGLADVLPCRDVPALRLQPERQPEQREEALGVEKEGDPADPPA